MYRLTVKSSGTYHNVVCGPRYCFTKKTAKDFIKSFHKYGCDLAVEKLVRLYADLFYWTDYDDGDSVFKLYDEVYEEES